MARTRGSEPRWDEASLRIRDRVLRSGLDALVRLFAWIGIDRAIAIGASVGRSWVVLGGPRVRRVREQLAVAMPEVAAARREEWAREVFVHFGRSLAESIVLLGGRRSELLERVRVEGLDHLEAAERQTPSGGALIVTAHLGNWELCAAKAASIGIRLAVVMRGLGQPVLDRAVSALRNGDWGTAGGARTPSVQEIVMGRAGLRVVRAFEAGRKVVVLLDQDARPGEGHFVRFFGRLASTRSGPIALAVERGVPVVPVFLCRDPDGRGYRMRIDPALQFEAGSSDDEEALRRNVQTVTAVIEREIRESPGQWIWTHRRWRTQPVSTD